MFRFGFLVLILSIISNDTWSRNPAPEEDDRDIHFSPGFEQFGEKGEESDPPITTIEVDLVDLRDLDLDPEPCDLAAFESPLYDADDLIALTGSNPSMDPSATYALCNDIDMAGEEFEAISVFSGVLDGKGYTIRNLSVSDSGLIHLNEGEVKNLVLENLQLVGGAYVGALIDENQGTVESIQVEGFYGEGVYIAGAIVGENSGQMKDLSATDILFVANTELTYSSWNGGIVGRNFASGIVENAYASGECRSRHGCGGIVGLNSGTVSNVSANMIINPESHIQSSGVIAGSVSQGSLLSGCEAWGTTLIEGNRIGGVAGTVGEDAVLENCVSHVTITGEGGGIAGRSYGTIRNSSFDGVAEAYDSAGIVVHLWEDGVVQNVSVSGTIYGIPLVDELRGGLVENVEFVGTAIDSDSAGFGTIYSGTVSNARVTGTLQGVEAGMIEEMRAGLVEKSFVLTEAAPTRAGFVRDMDGGEIDQCFTHFQNGTWGGFVYRIDDTAEDARISNSYTRGAVMGTSGGFAHELENGTVEHVYAANEMSSPYGDPFEKHYSESNQANYLGAFYEIINDLVSNAPAVGLSNEEITSGQAFEGWDLDVWEFEQDRYPRLKNVQHSQDF